MNKNDFLSRLRTALSPLPQEERDAAMSYYEEFFSDAGEDNEQSVIASLGAPEDLAKSIIDENNRENPANNVEMSSNNVKIPANNRENPANNTEIPAEHQNNSGFEGGSYTPPPPPPPQAQTSGGSNGQTALIIVLAVLSAPIWIGILCAIFGIIVGIFGAIIGLIASLGACAIAFLVTGFMSLLNEPAVGVMMIGLAFICAGLFPLAIVPLFKLAVKGAKACVKGIGSLFNKITGRKENVQ